MVDCAQDFSNVCPPNLVVKGKDGSYVGCLLVLVLVML